jgi:hypothetical protein
MQPLIYDFFNKKSAFDIFGLRKGGSRGGFWVIVCGFLVCCLELSQAITLLRVARRVGWLVQLKATPAFSHPSGGE